MLYIRPTSATAGHESRIRKLQCWEEFVYSSSLDETIRVWHPDGSLASLLTPHHSRVKDFVADDCHHVYSLTEDGSLQIFLPGQPPVDNELVVQSYEDFVRESFDESYQVKEGGTSPHAILPTRSISCPRGTAICCTAAALVICHSDSRVSVTVKNDMNIGAAVMSLSTPSPLLCLDEVSANCAVLGGADGNTYWLDIRKSSLRPLVGSNDSTDRGRSMRGYTYAIRSLGEYTGVTISQDNSLRFWDWRKPEEPWHSYAHPTRITAMNASDEYFVFGDEDGQVFSLRQSRISEALISHSKDILGSTLQSPAVKDSGSLERQKSLTPELRYVHSKPLKAVGAIAVAFDSTLFCGHRDGAIVNAGRLEADSALPHPCIFPYSSPVKHSAMLTSQHHILYEKYPAEHLELKSKGDDRERTDDGGFRQTDLGERVLKHLYTKVTDQKLGDIDLLQFDECASKIGATMVSVPKYFETSSSLKGYIEIGIPLSDCKNLLGSVTLGSQWFGSSCRSESTPKIINIGYAVVYSIYCQLAQRSPSDVPEPWLASVLTTFDWRDTHLSITSKRGFVAGSLADIIAMTNAEKFLRYAVADDSLVTALINVRQLPRLRDSCRRRNHFATRGTLTSLSTCSEVTAELRRFL